VGRERISAGVYLAEKWQELLKPIITQYAPKDIFNVDEMALFL
jgi:hypothetical protein